MGKGRNADQRLGANWKLLARPVEPAPRKCPLNRPFAGAECGSRVSQINLNPLCARVRATEHAPRDPYRILERRHGLAQIVERGAVVFVERPRGMPSHTERDLMIFSDNASRHRNLFAQQ